MRLNGETPKWAGGAREPASAAVCDVCDYYLTWPRFYLPVPLGMLEHMRPTSPAGTLGDA
jgi:hypothetical protein